MTDLVYTNGLDKGNIETRIASLFASLSKADFCTHHIHAVCCFSSRLDVDNETISFIHLIISDYIRPPLHSDHTSMHQAWNVTSHTLTHPSAPALASRPDFPAASSSHKTALTPPGPAFLMAIFFMGLATLHTNTWVSREPEAQCNESDVQVSELTRAEWKDQRAVIIFCIKQGDGVVKQTESLDQRMQTNFLLGDIKQHDSSTRLLPPMLEYSGKRSKKALTSPEARSFPSGENAKAETTPLFPSRIVVSSRALPSQS